MTIETSPLAAVLAAARQERRRRRLALAVLLPVVLGGSVWAWRARQGQPAAAIQFETRPVTRGALTVKVTATGTLQPVTQVDVGSEVSGTVEQVLVYFNDRVEAGQVLARLDTTQFAARERQSRAALALAEARVKEAQATVTETDARLSRSARLLERKLTPRESHEALQAAAERARAGLGVAEAQVQQSRAQLDYDRRVIEKSVIHAPISGIVLKRQVEPGQTVVAALQTPVLFTLAESLGQMLLNVQVDEADVGKVAAGQHAEFTVDAYPNRRFPAEIKLVRYVPQTVEGVVTYEAQLSVDNSELLLRPGMTATAEIVVQKDRDALLVPNAALRFTPPAAPAVPAASPGLVSKIMMRPPPMPKRVPPEAAPAGARVWTLRNGQPQPLSVTSGATDGALTEIAGGEVAEGLQVITGTAPAASP